MSVVADYVAFCTKCGGAIAIADASTPENKKSHQKYARKWATEGHKVILVEHDTADPPPRFCVEYTKCGGLSVGKSTIAA